MTIGSNMKTILIAGGVGTGKTTLALQCLFNAARNDERCLFIASVSEPVTAINNHLASFSFFDADYENMHFVDACELLIEKKDVFGILEENIESIKPDRVVIDSFLSLANRDKNALYALFAYVKRKNRLLFLTDVFTEETLNEHYIAPSVDGVIFLSMKEGRRWLKVLKTN
jgi:circadian clock protein KaiC